MRNILFILILANYYFHPTYGQSPVNQDVATLREKLDSKYGLNPWLYNGIKYFPDHPNSYGHPFWKSEEPVDADIVLNNVNYDNLKIQYNSYTQAFVLNYLDQINAKNSIILNNSQIDTVKMDDCIFIKHNFREIKEPFIQIIFAGNISCFITWSKEYNFYGTGSNPGHYYSDDIRKIYLILAENIYQIRKKRDLLQLFNKEQKSSISSYLSKNNIHVRNISHVELQQLIGFCNTIQKL